jgi:hypothetical protein
MATFLSDIDNNIDLGSHLLDVRKSTEMVLGALLSGSRRDIVKFPLSENDISELNKLITRD